MSVFNSEDTIAYSLHSLLNQTYENIEILSVR
ncbi:glycosyltransferase family 2 protein [Escherichia coli]|nr:glycosyltransferase family 2 protein [Escherichia coli]